MRLLLGRLATHPGAAKAGRVERFSTTADLRERLSARAPQPVDAVFHAAAVSDFTFGKIWTRGAEGQLSEVHSGKIPTTDGTVLAELLPTPKIIAELRQWYPQARLIGWKYEVEGDRQRVLALAEQQLAACRTNACVANGRAYGPGFRAGDRFRELHASAGLRHAVRGPGRISAPVMVSSERAQPDIAADNGAVPAPSAIPGNCFARMAAYVGGMKTAKKLLHTRYRVNDLESTVKFYRDALGLTETRRQKSPRGSELVFMKAPESDELIELCCFPASGPVQVQADLTHLAFEVDSLEEFGRHIAALGYKYSDGPHLRAGGGGIAFVDAPEGYEIELIQRPKSA